MTFYEAALCVLQKEGRPLHVEELTKIVLANDLLSHVGKTPQEVMENRMVAMAKKPRDRRICITAPHTFGLVEWGLTEDRAALDLPILDTYEHNTGPLLRGRERDPDASPAKVRIAGRGERTRGLWREETPDRRRHEKVKSLPEIIIEILSACKKPITAVDLAAAARDRDVLAEELGAESLVHLLRDENRKRSEMGKRPSFEFLPTGEITLTAFTQQEEAPREASDRALTGGRLTAMAAEQRRNIVRVLRRRLGELEGQAFDRVAAVLLERSGFSDLKIARRNRDGLVILGRRKEGLTELRYAVRVIRGTPEVSAQDVEEHSKSLGQFGSQMGVIISAGDATREARQASQSSVPMVFLFCADALADACIAQGVGVAKTAIEFIDLDEDFFRKNSDPAKDDKERRRAAGGNSGGASDRQQANASSRSDDRQSQSAADGQSEQGQSKKSRREEMREKRWQERQQRRQEQQAKAAAEAAAKGNAPADSTPAPDAAPAQTAAAPSEAAAPQKAPEPAEPAAREAEVKAEEPQAQALQASEAEASVSAQEKAPADVQEASQAKEAAAAAPAAAEAEDEAEKAPAEAHAERQDGQAAPQNSGKKPRAKGESNRRAAAAKAAPAESAAEAPESASASPSSSPEAPAPTPVPANDAPAAAEVHGDSRAAEPSGEAPEASESAHESSPAGDES